MDKIIVSFICIFDEKVKKLSSYIIKLEKKKKEYPYFHYQPTNHFIDL